MTTNLLVTVSIVVATNWADISVNRQRRLPATNQIGWVSTNTMLEVPWGGVTNQIVTSWLTAGPALQRTISPSGVWGEQRIINGRPVFTQ